MRKTEKPLPADEQIGDDAGCAAVETRCAASSRYLTWASLISARTSSSLGASHAMYAAVACA